MNISFQRSQNNTNNPRQSRQFCLLAEYIDEIQHISESTNVVADCFSRPPTDDTSLAVESTSTVLIDTYDVQGIASLQSTSFQQQMTEQYQHGKQMFRIRTTTLTCDKSIFSRPILSKNTVIQSLPISQPLPQQLEINVTYDTSQLHEAECPTHYQRMVPQLPHSPTDENHSPYTSSNMPTQLSRRPCYPRSHG